MPPLPDATWTPLDAAAERLGISRDAARKRLERGTLAGEKRHGHWFVLLDNLDTLDAGLDAMSDQSGRQSPEHVDAVGTPLDAMPDTVRELIDQLKSENAYLRDQLDQRSRELAAERERSDVIQQLALNRIPPLSAGEVRTQRDDDQPSTRTDPLVSPPQPPGSTEREKTTPDTLPVETRSWWRRLLGV